MTVMGETFAGKKIVLAGGGTGGHITPLIVIGKELIAQGSEILWLGDTGELTRKLVTDAGIRLETISTGKWRRYFSLENLVGPIQLLQGVLKALAILKKERPHAVLAKGGFASFPTVLAARQLRIPIVIHESDAVMGRANRIAARFAEKVCVSFPEQYFPRIPKQKIVVTGVPVASAFFTHVTTTKKSKKPNILVTGGSQGAQKINDVLLQALPNLLKVATVTHLTGQRDYPKIAVRAQTGYEVIGFTNDMPRLLQAADVVITRASSTTLAEIAASGKPAIIIPLPHAANNHQLANAQIWEKAGAGILLSQANLSPERLVVMVKKIVGNAKKLTSMHTAARALAYPEALGDILGVMASVLEKKPKKLAPKK